MSVEAFHFWSPTCTPCSVIKPALDDLKQEFDDVKWTSVNTHVDMHGVAKKMGIQAVPTIVVFKNGAEVGRHSGANMIMYYTLIRKARQST
uniref:Thioredoxin domain-containing protein n=1 Tax=viral metagenome TaxID=1070528 RepID=A0A6C0F1Z8_9ZZZZ